MANRTGAMEGEDPKPATEEPVVEEEVAAAAEEVTEDTEDTEEGDVEPSDPNEPLWEGGPSQVDIDQWKEQYENEDTGQGVYASILDPVLGRYAIWRCLERHEYAALSKQLERALNEGMNAIDSQMANEDAIVELCLLWPKYDRRNPRNLAGRAKRLANDILEMSGFVEVEIRKL